MNSDKIDEVLVIEEIQGCSKGKKMDKKDVCECFFSVFFRSFKSWAFMKIPCLKVLANLILYMRTFVGYNALAIVLMIFSTFKSENSEEISKVVLRSLQFPIIYFFLTFILALAAFPFLQNIEFLKVWIIFLFSFMISFFLFARVLGIKLFDSGPISNTHFSLRYYSSIQEP